MRANEINYTSSEYFAAAKLIEQLYKTGNISGVVFENILKEYSGIIDTTKFTDIETDSSDHGGCKYDI